MPVGRWFRRGAWLGAFALAASLTGTVAVPSQAAAWVLRLNMAGPPGTYYFSPDGDGIREVARAFYRLDRRADVHLQVRRGTTTLATIGLGTKPAGRKVLLWDGTDGDGHLFRDGTYSLRLVARTASGKVTRSDWAWAGVDTTIEPGEIRRHETTVYPVTPGVVDRLRFDYVAPTANSSEWGDRTVRVVDTQGKVVDLLGVEDSGVFFCDPHPPGTTLTCGSEFAWSGRHDGLPLPAGRYRLTVVQRDKAGNATQAGTWVNVSGVPLDRIEKSVTVSPADSGSWCNEDCGEFQNCGQVVEPGRFGPGSLSYRSADDCPNYGPFASASHRTPFESSDYAAFTDFRVTAYGGPTVPGDSDQGEIYAGSLDITFTSTGADTSDHETTTPWVSIDRGLGVKPHLSWLFVTKGTDNYDVDWFRVDYIVFQPPP